jgi:hypothetical protein
LELEKLAVEHLVLRDVVVRMLAYQALRWGDPKAFLTNFSNAGIRRAYMADSEGSTHEGLAGVAAAEVDWITNSALALATGAS